MKTRQDLVSTLSMHKPYDFLIIGGGIFGLTAAISLAKRSYRIGLLNPQTIPHHLAASTDVSKAVRMEYGSDLEYFRMAEKSIEGWHDWNDLFGEELYREVGFLMLSPGPFEDPRHSFERASCEQLREAGYATERLDPAALRDRFPAVNSELYSDAHFNPRGGYARSGRVVEVLADYARSLGVEVCEGQTASRFLIEKGRLQAVQTREGQAYSCAQAIVAAGACTPYLLPELQPYLKATGHPVFWLQVEDPKLFSPPQLSVFSADISNSGWYGFPYLPEQGIVKVARHANGLELHPERDDRQISDAEVGELRLFLQKTFPALAEAPLVYTRRCLYTDTLDGHFWIDRHPEIEGLSVSSGGSGHAFKMAPVLGEMTADMAEGRTPSFSERYRWRRLEAGTVQAEEARFVVGRKL